MHPRQRSFRTRLLLPVLALLAVAPAAAQPGPWSLRLQGVASDYEVRRVSGGLGGYNEVILDGGTGFEIAAQYRQNRWIGWEASLGRLSLDGRYRVVHFVPVPPDFTRVEERTAFVSSGDFVVQPLAVGLLVHLVHDRPVSLYVGPQVAWVEIDVNIPEARRREGDPGYGAKAGVELRPGSSPWSVGVELRYLEVTKDTMEHDLYGGMSLQSAALVFGYRLGGG